MKNRLLCGLLIGWAVFFAQPIYSFSDANKAEGYQDVFLTTNALIRSYEKKLGFYANPFAYVFNSDEANLVYQGLLTQERDFFCEDSYLFKLKLELIKNSYDFDLESGNQEKIKH